jgi:hypothetical protein
MNAGRPGVASVVDGGLVRSPACGSYGSNRGLGAASGTFASPAIEAPQLAQNRASLASSDPHWLQYT